MKVLKSAFNMQNILSSDEHLYEVWKRAPFVFDEGSDGLLIVKMIDPDNDGKYVEEW